MEKELFNALVTISNYCEKHKCPNCELNELCNRSFQDEPSNWGLGKTIMRTTRSFVNLTFEQVERINNYAEEHNLTFISSFNHLYIDGMSNELDWEYDEDIPDEFEEKE